MTDENKLVEKEDIEVICPHCGHILNVTDYHVVNLTGNEALRNDLMEGKLDKCTCPKCHREYELNTTYDIIPDDNKSVVLRWDDRKALIHEHLNRPNERCAMDDDGGLTIIGVYDKFDRNDKLLEIKHDLDYRVAEIYKTCALDKAMDYLKETLKGGDIKYPWARFTEKDDKLYVKITCTYRQNEGKGYIEDFEEEKPFDEDMYYALYDEYILALEDPNVFDYYFDEYQSRKFMGEVNVETTPLMVAEIYLPYYDFTMFAKVLAFNEKDFKACDGVVIRGSRSTYLGVIKHLFKTTNKGFPIREEEAPVVMWHYKPTTLTTSGSSRDDLDNAALLEQLRKTKVNGECSAALCDVDVITQVSAKVNLDDVANALESDTLSGDKVSLTFETARKGDDTYLCVYTSKDAINGGYAYSKFIYKFDDLARMVLSEPDRYQGIVVNFGTDNIAIDMARLLDYSYERIMCNADKMKALYKKLTKEEKDYLGEYHLDLISEPYTDGHGKWDPEVTGKRWNKTKEEIDHDIDVGYGKLMEIVTNNYYNN